jgi:hypothetical protein
LAAWFAILLAIAPFARPLSPADLTPAPAAFLDAIAPQYSVAQAKTPAPRVRPAQPWDLGVLARWSRFETTPALGPAKSPLVRLSAADEPLAPPKGLAAFEGDLRDVFHRGSVGTARRPTGPPSPESAFA